MLNTKASTPCSVTTRRIGFGGDLDVGGLRSDADHEREVEEVAEVRRFVAGEDRGLSECRFRQPGPKYSCA